jgi:hypothetical protein
MASRGPAVTRFPVSPRRGVRAPIGSNGRRSFPWPLAVGLVSCLRPRSRWRVRAAEVGGGPSRGVGEESREAGREGRAEGREAALPGQGAERPVEPEAGWPVEPEGERPGEPGAERPVERERGLSGVKAVTRSPVAA